MQEIVDEDVRDSGYGAAGACRDPAHPRGRRSRIPRTIECELTDDLVDACVPGDIIVATGEIKVVSSDAGFKAKKAEQTMFLLYLSTNSIIG